MQADPGLGLGGVPIRLLANVPNAVEMRVGNTVEELALSDWRDYSAESHWWSPTGTGHSVHMEFRFANGTTTTLTASVPPFEIGGSTDFVGVMPVSPVLPHFSIGVVYWSQDFEIGRDGWSSHNGNPGGVAEYMPVSHSTVGGVGDGAYVWADDSRWAPLDDGSVLALVVQPDWANPLRPTVDFNGKTLSFSLNEDGLASEAQAFLWIETAAGRWRSTGELNVGSGNWGANSLLLEANPAAWVALGDTPGATPIDLTAIVSWGVLLDPAGGPEPTGRLGIDSVTVVAPTPGPISAHNLTQNLALTEGAGPIAVAGLHIDAPADQQLHLTLRLSDAGAGKVVGFGDAVGGAYVMQGTTAQLNALLATLTLAPAVNQDEDFSLTIEIRDHLVGAPVTSGVVSFDVAAVQDAATINAAASGVSYRHDAAGVLLPVITVSDPDSNAELTVTITQVSGQTGRLIGEVAGSAGAYQISGSVDAVNTALKTLVYLPALDATAPAVFQVAVSDGIQLLPDSRTITLTPLTASQTATGIVLPGAPISIAETSINGTVVAVLGGTDAYGAAYSFRLADDADGRFAIATDGTLSVADTYAIDFEQAASHDIRVLAVDAAGNIIEQTVTVAVDDVQPEVIRGDSRNGAAYGGIGNDYFYPSLGADLMAGGVGDDFYQAQHEGDLILENPGEGTNDQIVAYQSYTLAPGSEIEHLSIVFPFTTEAYVLLGNAFAQTITGNDGDNRIGGGGGLDTLTGLLGRDTFVFASPLGVDNVATISDFSVGTDRIELSGTPFAGLAAGSLAAAAFEIGEVATTAAHRVIYNSATGALSYDADGAGGAAATVFARLATGLALTADDFVVAHPLVAEDLSPGQFLVGELRGESPAIYSYPVTLYANIPDAVEMRFGNTREELAGADWQDYADTATWLVKSGLGARTVFAEFRLSDGTIHSTSALTPDFARSLAADYSYEDSGAVQIGDSDGILWADRFEDDVHRWASYDYRSGNHELSTNQNVFYQATWAETGGVDGGGYVWMDDSRWIIDTPESPHSILALLTYPRWLAVGQNVMNLTGTTVEFYLKGDDLDLNGAHAYFWVLDIHGRWKDYTVELDIGEDDWAFNSLTLDPARLTPSWNLSGEPLNLAEIFSWGIGFVGFDQGQEPTGTLMLDEFVIRQAEPVQAEGLDQYYAVASSLGNVSLAPMVIHHPSSTGYVRVTFTFSDAAAGSIVGAVDEGGGVFTLSGTVTEINSALAGLTVLRNTAMVLDAAIVVSVDDGVAGTTDPRGLIMLDVNELPSLDFTGQAIAEFSPAGTLVGTASASDPDSASQTLTFSLDDDAGGRFAIDAATGALTVLDPARLNYEAATQHQIVIRVTDSLGAFSTSAQTITLTDALERIIGTPAADTLQAPTDENWQLYGESGDDLLVGTGGDDLLRGGPGYDTLVGGDGNDQLLADEGVDRSEGGAGDDQYFVDSAADVVIELAGEGNDIVYTTVSYALGAGAYVEVLSTSTQAATTAIDLAGNEFANHIVGNAGANVLNGGGGVDLLVGLAGNDQLIGGSGADIAQGGLGDDWYFVDSLGDRVIEAANEGRDIVYASVSYILGANVHVEVLSAANQAATTGLDLGGNELDNIIVGSAGNNVLYGHAGDDWLTGLAGNDQLIGGSGIDVTDGGLGNDWHFVDNAADRVVERDGEGSDIVYASVDYVLGAGASVELLSSSTQSSTTAQSLTGNEIANIIVGNAGSNVLKGRAGDDWLTGLAGNDQLIGGSGIDVTDGGLGDDWHFLDNAADRVVERAGEGTDTIYVSVDYILGAGISVEILSAATQSATDPLALTGNEIANMVVGNAGSNVLKGRAGDDWLTGLAGNDQLIGGSGIDVTDGGLGNDWHFVDNAADRVVERDGEGNDIVYASVDYVLGAGASVELLSSSTQSSTTAQNLTGNEIANIIVGNAGSNVLKGRAGDDWLTGLAGNDQLIGGSGIDVTDGGLGDDWHFVDNAADRVVERAGEGRDIVYTYVSYVLEAGVSVEVLSAATQASPSALNLTGNEIGNLIVGTAGNNVIDGKLGADFLKGLEGADTFAFTTALGGDNIDVIEGFTPGSDTIRLDDAVFTGLALGHLPTAAFVVGAAAADAGDRIIYDSQTGALFFDADGVGGSDAIQFARLSMGLTSLAAIDFIVA